MSLFFLLTTVFLLFAVLPSSILAEIFGYVGKDHVVLTSSGGYAQGSTTLAGNYPWIRSCTETTMIACYGDSSDLDTMMTQVDIATRQYQLKYNNLELSPRSIAHICRHCILTNPTKSTTTTRNSMELMLLIGGYDCRQNRCVLYYLDAYGGLKEVDYAAQGASLQSHIYSLLDQKHVQLSSPMVTQDKHQPSKNKKKGLMLKRGLKHGSALRQLTAAESEDFVAQTWQTLQRRSTQSLLTSIHTKIIRKPPV